MTDEALRSAMVDRISKWQPISAAVAAAMRAVPRHLFIPGASLEDAYANDAVITRRDDDGVATSSASAPGIVAMMLDQLEVRPGHRVLEIGAGTGYNAALLAELVGREGHVTTVDITSEVVEDARKALASAGVGNVEVVCGDGEYGHASNAPYDRMIVTAGAWDLPPAWADQLAPDGILVVPLRVKGFTRSIAFSLDTDAVWRSRSAHECGFMPVRGDGAVPERNIRVGDALWVRVDDGREVDAPALANALAGSGVVTWTGVDVDESLERSDYWLAELDGFCRILLMPEAAELGLVEAIYDWGSMGAVAVGTIAYLTKRPGKAPRKPELGVCAYGTNASELAGEVAKRLRAWDAAGKRSDKITIEVHPTAVGAAATNVMFVAHKRHTTVLVRADDAEPSRTH